MQSKELTQIFEAIDIACLKPIGSLPWKEAHRFEFREMDPEIAIAIIEREAPRLGKDLAIAKADYKVAEAKFYAEVDAAKERGESNPWQCDTVRLFQTNRVFWMFRKHHLKQKARSFQVKALAFSFEGCRYWELGTDCCEYHRNRHDRLSKVLWAIQRHFPYPN